jgi:hypothetical protein
MTKNSRSKWASLQLSSTLNQHNDLKNILMTFGRMNYKLSVNLNGNLTQPILYVVFIIIFIRGYILCS